jgi:ribose-phosphate pyrophosphokinase
MSLGRLALFALAGTTDYGSRLASRLNTALTPVEEREFEDGEHKIRPLASVHRLDAYVIHALHGDDAHSANDKLCRLLFLIAALKDHGAARVTAVLPYLCYARKDRRTQPYDPVTSRYVAALFEAMGTDQVMAVEVHNPSAFDNAFTCPTQHIATAEFFAAHFMPMAKNGPLVVVSPDAGGVKRAELFRRALERLSGSAIDNAFVEKYRSGGVVTGGALVGGVQGRTAVILDDLISTGGTLLRAAKACRAAGAARVFGAAVHGLFTGGACELFASADFDGLVVSDTVPLPKNLPAQGRERLTVLDSTALLADAITRVRSET